MAGIRIAGRGNNDPIKELLAKTRRNLEPQLRGALNTVAAKARKEFYVSKMGALGSTRQLNRAIRVKRARGASAMTMQARLIPSSAGLPVTQYKTWGIEPISATRARVFVIGPGGRKIAAGFVNPSSADQSPLSTRHRDRTGLSRNAGKGRIQIGYKIGPAMAPSVAYWFWQLTTPGVVQWIHEELAREFQRRIEAALK